jgi:hypothetical protein
MNSYEESFLPSRRSSFTSVASGVGVAALPGGGVKGCQVIGRIDDFDCEIWTSDSRVVR